MKKTFLSILLILLFVAPIFPTPSPGDTLQIFSGQSHIWNFPIVVNETYIRIDSGALLTVTDTAWMMPGAKIIVMPGGRMVIDNGMLTGFCSWQGIEVWGNDKLSQTTANQGKIELKNGATIKNTEIAVRIGKSTEAVPDGSGTPAEDPKGGGIIIAENANFINNEVGVFFDPYAYHNTSRFLQCDFSYDQEISSEDLIWFAKLNSVRDVRFAGCDFTNNTGTTGQCSGIWAYNSTFYVDRFCTAFYGDDCTNWDVGTFNNLTYGIYAIASTTTPFADIRNTVFEDNVKGIYLGGMTLPRVSSNEFRLNASPTGECYGLYLDECTDYWIEGNTFADDQSNEIVAIGIVVNESGREPNEVYRNTFEDLEYGILAQGVNRDSRTGDGLLCKCNTFTDGDYDIVVNDAPGESTDFGIGQYQGSSDSLPDAPAGNRFSWTGPTGTNTDINNLGLHFNYYYHDVNPFYRLKPEYYDTLKVNAVANQYADWDSTSCISYLDTSGGGSTEESMRNLLSESTQASDSLNQLIQALEDAGDTEAMEWTVDMSIPEQSWEVYSQLMNTAPYISDTVMGAAIEKEEVLPDVMLRDVMVASPESAKDDILLQKLDERSNQMPGYMLGQILQGRSLVSVYGDLMARQAYQNNIQAQALKHLKLYYSSNIQALDDSLVILLEKQNSLHAKYSLAFLYLQQNDSIAAIGILNQIPTQFALDEGQQWEHNQLVTYVNLIQLQNDLSPDSTVMALLSTLAGTQKGHARVYARNTLLAMNAMDYMEPIYLPGPTKSALADEYRELIKLAKEHEILQIQPNPAKDYLIVTWEMDKLSANLVLMISSLDGKIIKEIPVNGNSNQKVVDTSKLQAGIYIVSLHSQNQLIDSEKISIIK